MSPHLRPIERVNVFENCATPPLRLDGVDASGLPPTAPDPGRVSGTIEITGSTLDKQAVGVNLAADGRCAKLRLVYS